MKPYQRYHSTISFTILAFVFYGLSLASLLIPGEKAEQMAPVFFATLGITVVLIPFIYWAEKSARYHD